MQIGFNTQPPEGGCTRGSGLSPPHQRFQHTATWRWLPLLIPLPIPSSLFQHTATWRWLQQNIDTLYRALSFQHTATWRWLHTRAKAPIQANSFNTQPPEGGCLLGSPTYTHFNECFNTQPPEGGCIMRGSVYADTNKFQHTATWRWLQLTRFSLL